MFEKPQILNKLSRIKDYLRENWGAPFVLGFMGLLLVAVVLLILGFSLLAEAVGNYAYFSLVAGVVLQLVCFMKHGEKDGSSD